MSVNVADPSWNNTVASFIDRYSLSDISFSDTNLCGLDESGWVHCARVD
jgi:hypothetical protein